VIALRAVRVTSFARQPSVIIVDISLALARRPSFPRAMKYAPREESRGIGRLCRRMHDTASNELSAIPLAILRSMFYAILLLTLRLGPAVHPRESLPEPPCVSYECRIPSLLTARRNDFEPGYAIGW
jgi:hypothetical protein